MRLPCLKHVGQINVHKQPKKRPEIHRKSKSVVTPGVGIRRLLRRRPGCPWVHGSKGTWVQGHMGPRAHGSKGPWPMMAQMGPRGSYGRVQGPPPGIPWGSYGIHPRDPWVPARDPWVPPYRIPGVIIEHPRDPWRVQDTLNIFQIHKLYM